ncbi:MAG: CYTH domain-containing protein [bacterium]|nr:CYTH domain-containing protein [bacterium]
MTTIKKNNNGIWTTDSLLNHEVEIKYRILERDAFFRVIKEAEKINNLAKSYMLKQKNYFFDTDDSSLRNKSLLVRLRKENDSFLVSLKGNVPKAKQSDTSLSIRLEYEFLIDSDTAAKILKQQIDILTLIGSFHDEDINKENTRVHLFKQIRKYSKGKQLELIGYFSNQRTCVPVQIKDHKLILEFDETQFPLDITHYEVELEIPKEFDYHMAEQLLVNLFDKAKADYFDSNGKSTRFHNLLAS